MKKEDGQIITLATLLFPVFAVLVVFAVDFGCLVFFKIKLQIAADRAAIAGAGRLAEIMNTIADENIIINDAFLKLEKNFKSNSQQSISECEARVAEAKNIQGEALQDIGNMIGHGYEEANEAARLIAQEYFPGVQYETLAGQPGDGLFSVSDVRADIVCGNIKGIFVDPTGVESKANEGLLKYIYSNREYVALALRLSFNFRPPFMEKLYGSVPITSTAAAQPYGGSISPFILQKKIGAFKPARVPVAAVVETTDNEEIYFE